MPRNKIAELEAIIRQERLNTQRLEAQLYQERTRHTSERRELQRLEESNIILNDELKHLKCRARAFETNTPPSSPDNTPEPDSIAHRSRELDALTITELRNENQALRCQLRTFEGDFNDIEKRYEGLEAQLKDQESQMKDQECVKEIGCQVRRRFLELYISKRCHSSSSQSSSSSSFIPSEEPIQRGKNATRRGKPLADAYLYRNGLVSHPKAFVDLYGISPDTLHRWREVREIVDICAFRGTLVVEGKLKPRFNRDFAEFLSLAGLETSANGLKNKLKDSGRLKGLLQRMDEMYDEVINDGK